MNYRSVKAVAERLRAKWGVEMDLWQVAANCKQVMMDERVIPRLKKLKVATVEDFTVNLGEQVTKIVSVTQLMEPVEVTTGSIVIGDIIFPPQTVWVSQDPNEDITADELTELNSLPYLRGPYIPYEQDGPHLKFNATDFDVAIVYACIATNDDGSLLIPEDLVVPLADYCAEVHLKPLFLLGKVQPAIYETIKFEVNQSWGNARTNMMLTQLSQNRTDELLQVMAAMDRKGFNVNT